MLRSWCDGDEHTPHLLTTIRNSVNGPTRSECKGTRRRGEARFSDEELVLASENIEGFVLFLVQMRWDFRSGSSGRLELEIGSSSFGGRHFEATRFPL